MKLNWFWKLSDQDVGDEGMDLTEDEKRAAAVRPSYGKEIADICNIFLDVTGLSADPKRETFVIQHWLQRGWSLRDFRLLIEHQFHDPRQKDFYAKAGNLNLRLMLNPSSADRLLDILEQLRFGEKIKESKAVAAPSKVPMMLMRCGEKIPLGDKIAYENHNRECFEKRGQCFS